MKVSQTKTLSESQAAAIIGIHPETLARLRRDRKIPSWRKIGRRVKYTQEDIDRAIASFEQGSHVQARSEGKVLEARFG